MLSLENGNRQKMPLDMTNKLSGKTVLLSGHFNTRKTYQSETKKFHEIYRFDVREMDKRSQFDPRAEDNIGADKRIE